MAGVLHAGTGTRTSFPEHLKEVRQGEAGKLGKMPSRPASLLSASERDIEAALRQALTLGGFHVVKTDAGMVGRGSGRGHIASGFPDLVCLHRLPGSTLSLAALIETKTATGRLRESQVTRHAELRDVYGLTPHVLRDPAEALLLIQEARRLRALLAH